MRGIASYLLAGILVVLAMDIVAPPIGLGFSVGAWPVMDSTVRPAIVPVQVVDRTGKGDRLRTSTIGKQQEPVKPPMLVGCDPAFSPLSTSARMNFAGRCVADLGAVPAFAG